MQNRAFSLVELSIVLVILGLLVGGVLAGQSLIRASELRSVGSDFTRYSTAIYAFRDKYFAFPGDMANATTFWGDAGTGCTTSVGQVYLAGTCNGDASGTIDYGSVQKRTGEAYQAWKHLALAGLIEGQFTGIAGDQWSNSYELGKDCPLGKISSSCWAISNVNRSTYVGNVYYQTDLRFAMAIGKPLLNSSYVDRPILIPNDAWNIDTKMDDGMPGQGKVMAGSAITSCTTAASNADFTGTYNLSATDIFCNLFFKY